jgi:hypothetical protein
MICLKNNTLKNRDGICLIMILENEIEDVRGKIIFYLQNDRHVSVIEMKKGYSRGGHYHPQIQDHIIISGKLEYREEDINTKQEEIRIIEEPTVIKVPANLFIAIEDTIFVESFVGEYQATNYLKYRKDVEDRIKNNLK